MRSIDELAVRKYGILLEQKMELAGFNLMSLARQVLGGSLQNKRVVVLTGKGNNGGGGLVAARHMSDWGAKVVILVSQRTGLNDTVNAKLRTLQALSMKILFFDPKLNIHSVLETSDLVIDALIGYNLKGNPRYPISEIIMRANVSQIPILALDLPSGLDATTGNVYDPCIKAENTLTLALPKIGLQFEKARKYVGTLYLADIGIPPALYREMGLNVGNIFKDESMVKIC